MSGRQANAPNLFINVHNSSSGGVHELLVLEPTECSTSARQGGKLH